MVFESQSRRDAHAALSPEEGYLVEVTSLYNSSAIPIYLSPAHSRERISLLVEGLPIAIWVLSPTREEAESAS